jgi:hypothetical protein
MNNIIVIITTQPKMQNRINSIIDNATFKLKQSIAEKLQGLRNKCVSASDITTLNMNQELTSILDHVYSCENLKLTKDDFKLRKRVKNSVPLDDRCQAKRANGEQCTRRKKDNHLCCGTHTKGTPHGMINVSENLLCTVKIETWVQDIKGIMYHVDNQNNVYDPEDIISNKVNPRVISKYTKIDNVYTLTN